MQYLGETLEVAAKACVKELCQNGGVSCVIALDNSKCDRVALVPLVKGSLNFAFSCDAVRLLGDVPGCGVYNYDIHALDLVLSRIEHDQVSRYHCAATLGHHICSMRIRSDSSISSVSSDGIVKTASCETQRIVAPYTDEMMVVVSRPKGRNTTETRVVSWFVVPVSPIRVLYSAGAAASRRSRMNLQFKTTIDL